MIEAFQSILNTKKIWRPDQIGEVLQLVRPNFRFSYCNQKHKYFNVPAAFDIETSSFYDANNEKTGIMYCWAFGLYGAVIFGRTWEEFTGMLQELAAELDLNENKRLIVYVHNLGFDFQFFRKHFHYNKVFAISRRKPAYALTDIGIEFRCSYILSGYSLAKLGDELTRYKVRKMVGDLDYNLIRHQKTPMTKTEIGYCAGDVKVVMAYIQEQIEDCGGLARVPLTKTGYVREYCRNSCFYEAGISRKKSKKRAKYMKIMQRLTLNPELYQMSVDGFAGGYTHSNSIYVASGRWYENIASLDFTSSYPAVMIAEDGFPMGVPEKVDCTQLDRDSFRMNISCYACLFSIDFTNLRQRPEVYDSYLSESRCSFPPDLNKKKELRVNNGRIVYARELNTTITEQDFLIINKVYTFTSIRIRKMYRWQRGYLPTDFVDSILTLYEKKTELKNVPSKEIEYMVSKGMLNATFGMSCTNVIREVCEYSDDWEKPYIPDLESAIEKYNKSGSRFLYYVWGLYVCCFARRNLWAAILECGEDYLYSDTDSVKIRHLEKHQPFFDDYNRTIIMQLEKAMDYHGFDRKRIRPKTIKGVEKPLGVWDYEETYKRFKSLGAKRYMTESQDGIISFTVSGVNKKIGVPYICNGWRYDIKTREEIESPFDKFRDGVFFPAEYSGKKTHTYIDKEKSGVVTDYLGNTAEYKELSSIHMEASSYRLSISQAYKQFLFNQIGGFQNG